MADRVARQATPEPIEAWLVYLDGNLLEIAGCKEDADALADALERVNVYFRPNACVEVVYGPVPNP